jgi:gliding motility-associated-like protein
MSKKITQIPVLLLVALLVLQLGVVFGQPLNAPQVLAPSCPTCTTPVSTTCTSKFPGYKHKPFQDCCGAKPLCFQENLIYGYDPTLPQGLRDTTSFICGSGCISGELTNGSGSFACGTIENQTTWYVFDIRPLPYPGSPRRKGSPAGMLRLKIIPLDIKGNDTTCSSSTSSVPCDQALVNIRTYEQLYGFIGLDDGSKSLGNTDYDWALYKIDNFGANRTLACTNIKNSTDTNSRAKKVSCNYTGKRGPTGLFEPGNINGGSGDPNFQNSGGSRFNPPIPVKVGDRYMLAVDNFSTNLRGAKIDFSGYGFTRNYADPSVLTIQDSSANVTLPTGKVVLDTAIVAPTCSTSTIKISFSRQVYYTNITKSQFKLSSKVRRKNGVIVDSIVPIVSIDPDTADPNYFNDGFASKYVITVNKLRPDTHYVLKQVTVVSDICYTQDITDLDSISFKVDPMLTFKTSKISVCSNGFNRLLLKPTLTADYSKADAISALTFTWKVGVSTRVGNRMVTTYVKLNFSDTTFSSTYGKITFKHQSPSALQDTALVLLFSEFTVDSLLPIRCITTSIAGCIDSSDYSLRIYGTPKIKISPYPIARYCYGDPVNVQILSPTNSDYTYKWVSLRNPDKKLPVYRANMPNTWSFLADTSDDYQLSVTDHNDPTTDTTDCTYTRIQGVPNTLHVIVSKPYFAAFDTLIYDSIPNSGNNSYPATYKFINKSYVQYPGGPRVPIKDTLQYLWNFGDNKPGAVSRTLKDTVRHTFTYEFTGNQERTYLTSLTIQDTVGSVVDANRCTPGETVPITLYAANIPNTLTPNNDGDNDKLVFYGTSRSIDLVVYNRWGKQMYAKQNYDNSWAGEGLPAGVYYYTMTDNVLPKNSVTKWFYVVK